ncbi:MAG: hypothetical protein WAT39_03410 [Planctomycetota bacterium]
MRCLSRLLLIVPALVAAADPAPAQGIWVNRMAPPGPGSCTGTLVGFDTQRNETVWFGDQACRETWVWNGATWTQRPTVTSPPAREVVGVFDSGRQCLVALFGGFSGPFETWEWDGVAWTQRNAGSPPPRSAFGLAYDAARAVTVLFGGWQGSDAGFADTWTWNGTAWTQVGFGGPTPRYSMGMTFDVQRQKVLLFGGRGRHLGQPAYFGDTWEWNGSYWFNHFGLAGPAPRQVLHRMVWDGVRQCAVLYGGSNQSGSLTDMWQWNGAWSPIVLQNNPGTNTAPMVFDRARSVVVKLNNTTVPAIWEFVHGPSMPATFVSYGAGCAGPAGVPLLANIPPSLPRIGTTLQLRLSNLPLSPLNVGLGFVGFDATSWGGATLPLSLTPFGFPGCDALLAPVRIDNLPNTNGAATWSFPVPMSAFALGVSVYFQGAVLVPGWNPGGLAFSNGGHAVIGSP